MIICVSANPAIDRRITVKNFRLGEVNRAVSIVPFAGGKAAHVAMTARALGEEVTWIGFLGGAPSQDIEHQLQDHGIKVIAVRTKSPTRTNDEIIDEHGNVTEILEPGAPVSSAELERMYEFCDGAFASAGSGFQAVFSGSLPQNVPPDFYARLIVKARERGGRSILDTNGTALLGGLAAEPDLVKPNAEEAATAAGLKIENEKDALAALRRFSESGPRSVAVSLGAKGIILANGNADKALFATPPRVKVISNVGCGDATVAGFAVAARRGWDEMDSLRLAVACGSANCVAEIPGQIQVKEVERLFPLVSVKTVFS